jgi:hypothetical protein
MLGGRAIAIDSASDDVSTSRRKENNGDIAFRSAFVAEPK